jgi:hypothetical protein
MSVGRSGARTAGLEQATWQRALGAAMALCLAPRVRSANAALRPSGSLRTHPIAPAPSSLRRNEPFVVEVADEGPLVSDAFPRLFHLALSFGEDGIFCVRHLSSLSQPSGGHPGALGAGFDTIGLRRCERLAAGSREARAAGSPGPKFGPNTRGCANTKRHAGTKHPRLIFRLGDVDHVMPVSGTPSDWGAGRKAMARSFAGAAGDVTASPRPDSLGRLTAGERGAGGLRVARFLKRILTNQRVRLAASATGPQLLSCWVWIR